MGGEDLLYLYTAMIQDEGNKSKFEKLYKAYRKIMFFEAKKILKDDYLAEDAVHQAFIKIINNLDKIDEKNCHKTKGFVVIIINRTSIDIYRKLKGIDTTSFDEMEFGIKDSGLSVEEIYEDKNENMVLKAILSLPQNYSSVIMLKYSHGYSNDEIAEILGISEINVRQRLTRGKKRLEQILKDWEVIYHGQ